PPPPPPPPHFNSNEIETDESLWARHIAGDTTAFSTLYSRWNHKLISFFQKRLCCSEHDAEDFAQKTWFRLFRKERREQLSSFRWKLYADAREGKSRFWHSRESRNPLLRADSFTPYDSIIRTEIELSESVARSELVQHILKFFSEEDCLLLFWRFYLGLSFIEIGARLSMTRQTAQQRIAKIIAIAKRKFSKNFC
ncbi:MAG TPA: hypothetical protein VFE46_10840, partial [Pirellulales bacterium]|nr:hypothetical protein [Pirellulales bacterium]